MNQMAEPAQRRIIATSAMIVVAVGWISAIQNGRIIPTSRFLIGFGFAFLITSIMADLGSPLGASFALIIMVATVLENGDAIVAWTGDRAAGRHGVSKPAKGPKKIAGLTPSAAGELFTDETLGRVVVE